MGEKNKSLGESMTWEMLVRSNNLNGPDLMWLRGQTAMLTETLFIWLCPGLEREVLPRLPHWPIALFHSAWGGCFRKKLVKQNSTKQFKSTFLNSFVKDKEETPRESLDLPPRQRHHCWIEPISCGPLTPDLPLGLCGAEGRSPHVVTACELLTSHWSPPLSLQDTLPPTSAISFFPSLGKFDNSLSSRPPRHWWDTMISLPSRPEACTVGCYDGSNHNLAGNLCLITGSGQYILLIINTVEGVLIPSLSLKLMWDLL